MTQDLLYWRERGLTKDLLYWKQTFVETFEVFSHTASAEKRLTILTEQLYVIIAHEDEITKKLINLKNKKK